MTALQLPLDLQFRPAYGRADFFITASNSDAVALLDAWPESWGGFPALTIYGAGGSGKSHSAAVWAQKADAQMLTPESFVAADLADLIENPRHLVLERIDLIVGDESAEQKIFHLYNAMGAAKKTLLLTSHMPPAQMNFVVRDVQSRLRASPAVEIHAPDDDLLSYVLAKQLHDRGLSISGRIARYAVERMERSWPALERVVHEISHRATAEKKGVTMAMVRDIVAAGMDEEEPVE